LPIYTALLFIAQGRWLVRRDASEVSNSVS